MQAAISLQVRLPARAQQIAAGQSRSCLLYTSASEFVRVVVGRTGVQIAALEEVAYRNGWINKEQLLLAADTYGKSPYGQHLRNVAEGKY